MAKKGKGKKTSSKRHKKSLGEDLRSPVKRSADRGDEMEVEADIAPAFEDRYADDVQEDVQVAADPDLADLESDEESEEAGFTFGGAAAQPAPKKQKKKTKKPKMPFQPEHADAGHSGDLDYNPEFFEMYRTISLPVPSLSIDIVPDRLGAQTYPIQCTVVTGQQVVADDVSYLPPSSLDIIHMSQLSRTGLPNEEADEAEFDAEPCIECKSSTALEGDIFRARCCPAIPGIVAALTNNKLSIIDVGSVLDENTGRNSGRGVLSQH
ncbi:hypothetical protein KIPB_008295, partial [Kipferlia bialata]|eukprot:g8295.t1